MFGRDEHSPYEVLGLSPSVADAVLPLRLAEIRQRRRLQANWTADEEVAFRLLSDPKLRRGVDAVLAFWLGRRNFILESGTEEHVRELARVIGLDLFVVGRQRTWLFWWRRIYAIEEPT